MSSYTSCRRVRPHLPGGRLHQSAPVPDCATALPVAWRPPRPLPSRAAWCGRRPGRLSTTAGQQERAGAV